MQIYRNIPAGHYDEYVSDTALLCKLDTANFIFGAFNGKLGNSYGRELPNLPLGNSYEREFCFSCLGKQFFSVWQFSHEPILLYAPFSYCEVNTRQR